ncbi:MAG TPA: cytochrome c3 family protein [Bdellovibrionota bacterium]|nr:cytochrome c3 family protein [Bdellovibrionota bacterium]
MNFIKTVALAPLMAAIGIASIQFTAHAEDCIDCHNSTPDAMAPDVLTKPNRHEAAVISCQSCHASHDQTTSFPHQLLGKVADLCFQCHDQTKILVNCHPGPNALQCSHPVFGHPIFKDKDGLYPDREFTCVSCHNPHSANMNKMFRYDYGENTPYAGNTCAVCHWGHFSGGAKPPTPPWSIQSR